MRSNTEGYFTQTSGASSTIDLTASGSSDPIYVGRVDSGSIQLVPSATSDAIGTMSVEVCDDPPPVNGNRYGASSTPPTNWVTVPALSASLSALTGSPFYIEVSGLQASWVRLTWTKTSGTVGTASARFNFKAGS